MKRVKERYLILAFVGQVCLLFFLFCGCQDADGDGILNQDDNCPAVANPDQADSDGNGVGDACEDATHPLPDKDGDGIPDQQDNCPAVANPDQADSDGNGIGDACESTPADTDGDGIIDTSDNCPSTSNTDQADRDGDSIGDACDNCPDTPNADQGDTDGDGLGNDCDVCPLNADHTDLDQDGTPDCSALVMQFTQGLAIAPMPADAVVPESPRDPDKKAKQWGEMFPTKYWESVEIDGHDGVSYDLEVNNPCVVFAKGYVFGPEPKAVSMALVREGQNEELWSFDHETSEDPPHVIAARIPITSDVIASSEGRFMFEVSNGSDQPTTVELWISVPPLYNTGQD
ncbi:MAG: thrombospondin type 3 repeat-containing protein [Planctomycetota bacterium]